MARMSAETLVRCKVVYMRPEALANLITHYPDGKHAFRVVKGVPVDSTLVLSYYDMTRQCWALVYQHPDFDYVPGDQLPEIRVEIMVQV